MNTRMLQEHDADIAYAAELIRQGEAVGFPTETVYGLGCNAYDAAAVQKVFAAKGRPADNPLIVHIAHLESWRELVTEIPPLAMQLAEAYWPGPLSMILPKSEKIPAVTAGGLDTVGVRFPSNRTAQRLIAAAGVPIAAPSGNRSGRPSPTTAAHMLLDMDGRIPAIIEGQPCLCGVESTVIAFDDAETVRVLRPGFITPADLGVYAKRVIVDEAVTAGLAPDTIVRSPGMKYKHYAPVAKVTLVQGDAAAVQQYIAARQGADTYALVFSEDAPAYAAAGIPHMAYGGTDAERAEHIFSLLRELDEKRAKQVYIRAPKAEGIGLAVYNRLIRAAGFDLVQLN